MNNNSQNNFKNNSENTLGSEENWLYQYYNKKLKTWL